MKYIKLFEDFEYPTVLYHGTENLFKDFNSDKPIFFVDNIDVAKTYGHIIVKGNLEINNPIIFDFDGKSTIFFYDKYYMPSELALFMKNISEDLKNRFSIDEDLKEEMECFEFNDLYGDLDGVIMKNIDDSMGDPFGLGYTATNYVVFDKKQIKIII